MTRLAALFLFTIVSALPAQTNIPLRFTQGQTLLYRAEHVTEATTQVGMSKTHTKSIVKVVKRWQVANVDPQGIATLQLSLVSMRQERSTPSGEPLIFDSANPDKSTPQLKEALAKYLNTTLAIVRIDPYGRVLEVKESKSDASNYENELPFLITVPAVGVKVGEGWKRDYKITLSPPLGTGEKYDAEQIVACKSITADAVILGLTTKLKSELKNPGEAVPLWQFQPEGEIVMDLKNARLHSAKLTINKQMKTANAEATFVGSLTVQYLGDK
jgi:hypothetical protein